MLEGQWERVINSNNGVAGGKAIKAPLEAVLRVPITNYVLSRHRQGLPLNWLNVSAHDVGVIVAIFQTGKSRHGESSSTKTSGKVTEAAGQPQCSELLGYCPQSKA